MMHPWQRTIGAVAVCIAVLLVAGFLWEYIAERRDLRLHPAPGHLVAVGDRKLHLLCMGSASPTVVVEQGAGELSSFWWPVQHEIAKFARVCTYDRAGFAWSDPVPYSRTIQDRAGELHALLANAAEQGPYILVAHSYGGLIVRDFQRRYPSEVVGLVLVDTPEELNLFQSDVLDFYTKARVMNRVVGYAAQFGILRALRWGIPLDRFGLWLRKPTEYATLCDDLASLEQVPMANRVSEKQGTLGSLPVVVITHGLPFPGPFAVLDSHWSEGQSRLAALSSNSLLIVAKNSNHMIQHDEPQLVVEAIRRIHDAARTGTPLV